MNYFLKKNMLFLKYIREIYELLLNDVSETYEPL